LYCETRDLNGAAALVHQFNSTNWVNGGLRRLIRMNRTRDRLFWHPQIENSRRKKSSLLSGSAVNEFKIISL
jgi:hypothetical protein